VFQVGGTERYRNDLISKVFIRDLRPTNLESIKSQKNNDRLTRQIQPTPKARAELNAYYKRRTSALLGRLICNVEDVEYS